MSRRPPISTKRAWIPGAIPFFLVGFAYYLVSPALVYQFMSHDNELLQVATAYIDSDYFNISYMFDMLLILGSFLCGYVLGRIGTTAKRSVLDYGSFQTSFPLLLVISFGILITYFAMVAAASGGGFFTGYSTYNVPILGAFSTCVFMAAWFVNYFVRRKVSLLFLGSFLICSLLLLGWGSRMYFVLGCVTLLLGVVSDNRRLLKSLWLYAGIAGFCILVLSVGIFRQGGVDFSSDRLVGIFFAEPLFTSISGSLYFENSGGRPTFAFPHDLFASVIHFIPSAIYPNKVQLLSELTFNENVQSPFGAKSLLVNLYSNFGRFYPLFVAAIGAYYGFLYTRARASTFYRAVYFSALPVLLLLFFREGLATVIKVLAFNGMLVPVFVAFMLIWVSPRPMADIRNRVSQANLDPSLSGPRS